METTTGIFSENYIAGFSELCNYFDTFGETVKREEDDK